MSGELQCSWSPAHAFLTPSPEMVGESPRFPGQHVIHLGEWRNLSCIGNKIYGAKVNKVCTVYLTDAVRGSQINATLVETK